MRAHCGFLSSDPAARAARRTLRLVPPARGRLQVRSRPHGSSGSGTEGRLRAPAGQGPTEPIPFCTSSARITFLLSGSKAPSSPSSRLEAGRERTCQGGHRAGRLQLLPQSCAHNGKSPGRRPPAPSLSRAEEPGMWRRSPGTRPGALRALADWNPKSRRVK